MTKNDPADPRGWKQEGKDLLRALAAGMIFGTPLLYTMEMWWNGVTFTPSRWLVLLFVTFCLNALLCYFRGIRKEYSIGEALSESASSVAIAILLSTGILILIDEISFETGVTAGLGKIIMQAVVVSIGISVTSRRFAEPDTKKDEKEVHEPAQLQHLQLKDDLEDLGATLAGAMVFAFNTAPTEEITQIASRLSPLNQLFLLFAEFAICYLILFASGFWSRQVYLKNSLFQKPFAETTVCCALSLVVAAALLLMVGHGGFDGTYPTFFSQTLVLGIPAVVGGAAGRLLI